MTGKCTRECDEYGHSDSCWMPVHTSPERRPSNSSAEQPGSQETLAMAAMANGDPTAAHMMGDRNRNLLNRKMEVLGHPTEEIPLAPTGEYKPTTCGTLTRREVYL
uniref:Uncharacterized protein n=1 Tax=Periophthalmus magnuspinnatus TaxID=409849 RepID=A0A3B3ZGW5_9GOBI